MQDDNTNQATDGKQDDNANEPNVIEPTIGLGTNPLDQQPGVEEASSSQPVADDSPGIDDTSAAAIPLNDSTADDSSSSDDGSSTTVQINDTPSDDTASGDDTTEEKPEEQKEEEPASETPQSDGDLESIRTSALQELTPIVSELDQEPEEKYRTLMMIIQASDNQSLIKEAYETAEKIDDKKARAEALLTIVNEINYFTGKDKSQPEV